MPSLSLDCGSPASPKTQGSIVQSALRGFTVEGNLLEATSRVPREGSWRASKEKKLRSKLPRDSYFPSDSFLGRISFSDFQATPSSQDDGDCLDDPVKL